MTTEKILAAVLSFILLHSFNSVAQQTETNSTVDGITTTNRSPAINDLGNLVSRINQKIQQGITTPAGLEENLGEFEQLLKKHKDAKEEERAEILMMKAQLYMEVLNDPEGGLKILKQYQQDFPNRQIQGDTAKVIQTVEREIAAKKIRASLVIGNKFPEFSVTDINGKPLSTTAYKGKVVLVDFWATWCVPCVMSLPDVIQTYKTYHSKGFDVIGVSLDEDPQRLKRFIRDREMEWPQFNDAKKWDGELVRNYGVQQIPTTYLLDKEGKIIGADLQGEDLEKAIKKALGITGNESKSEPAKAPKS
jgi:peroxiredoxin